MEIKIATFGCWNKMIVIDDRVPLFDVVAYLQLHQDEYSDLIILGDNYYPLGEKEQKQTVKLANGEKIKVKSINFIQEDFDRGFKGIESLGIPNKYLIMGNHDIEDTILQDCKGLTQQLSKTDKFTIPFPFGSVVKSIGSINYKYIFIDTTIYSLPNSEINCIFKTTNHQPSQVILDQNQFLLTELSDPSINYFLIFGHEPLLAVKTSSSTPEKVGGVTNLAELLLSINPKKDITYVCADVHMYQSGIISSTNHENKNTIKQIICGTGGGDKDYYTAPNKIFTENNIQFELKEMMDSFGYVEIILREDGISHTYNKINNELILVKYKKKYLIKYN